MSGLIISAFLVAILSSSVGIFINITPSANAISNFQQLLDKFDINYHYDDGGNSFDFPFKLVNFFDGNYDKTSGVESGNYKDVSVSAMDATTMPSTFSQETSVNESIQTSSSSSTVTIREFSIQQGSRPHDVAPAGSYLFTNENNSKFSSNDIVWYTAQSSGELGKLNTTTGNTEHIPLGQGSSPHGVIVGPDGAPWITDSGLNAIVRVDPQTSEVTLYPLPEETGYTNLNTATFDKNGTLWFTGQSGIYGRLIPSTGLIDVFDAPRGQGPYGITTTPGGEIYYASLAGSYIGRINPQTGEVTVIQPPTPDQGARRVWSDSTGQIWVTEWNSGNLAMYDPQTDQWKEWKVPGENPKPYAVFVDSKDIVWLSDFASNSMYSFDPKDERFEKFDIPSQGANIRQILGVEGQVWGAESGTDKLLRLETD